MPALAPYPTVEAILDGLPPTFTYGSSVEGRPLVGVDLGGEGPLVTVTSGLHGIEHIGVQVALEVLRRGPLAGAHLVVFPMLNPDGIARTHREPAARVRDLRKNARGVDLNRNFPMPHDATPSRWPGSGSSAPDAATYRGPAPRSEPEVDALATWMETHRPHASANLHSFMGVLLAARVGPGSDWRTYTKLGRAFRRGQGTRGYPRMATPWGDVFTGELEDWQHHALGCWAVCVESFSWRESLWQHLRAPNGFWRFNPRDPAPIARRDAGGVRAMLTAATVLSRPLGQRPRLIPSR